MLYTRIYSLPWFRPGGIDARWHHENITPIKRSKPREVGNNHNDELWNYCAPGQQDLGNIRTEKSIIMIQLPRVSFVLESARRSRYRVFTFFPTTRPSPCTYLSICRTRVRTKGILTEENVDGCIWHRWDVENNIFWWRIYFGIYRKAFSIRLNGQQVGTHQLVCW